MFESFQGGLLHHLPRGVLIGPNLKLSYRLLDEHFEARHGHFALLARAPDQDGFERIVDHVKNNFSRHRSSKETLVYMRKHSERRRVHHCVEMAGGGIISPYRLRAADTGE